jgi:hypothetical protein
LIAVGINMYCRPVGKTILALSFLSLRLSFPLRAQKLEQLIPRNVALKQVTYQGRSAVQLIAAPDAANASSYAILKDITFRNGTIEVDVAGKPAAGAGPGLEGSSA